MLVDIASNPVTSQQTQAQTQSQAAPKAAPAISGQQMIQDVLAQQAYDNAVANLNAQKANLNARYDKSNPYSAFGQIDRNYQDGLDQLDTGHKQFLETWEKDYAKAQRDSGFKANLNADGTLGNLELDPNNPYGQMQQINTRSALNEQNIIDQLASQGLGGSGIGRKQLAIQDFFDKANETSYRNQVIDAIVGLLTGKKNEGSDYSKRKASLDYNRGAAQYQAGLDFQAGLDAINAGYRDASYTKTSSVTDNAINAIIDRIQNGDFTPAAAPAAAPAPSTKTVQVPKLSAGPTKYYTTKEQANAAKKPGQTLKFTTGKGYYLA